MLGLAPRLGDRRIEQRLVGNDAANLDAAGGGQDHARLRVVDPRRQLVRGKPAKHDRMDRTDPRAGQHREGRFGHHRHVDQHAVALGDAEARQDPGEARDLALQFAIGEMPDLAGDRAIPDQRDPLAATRRDMAVDGIPAGVEPAAGKPAEERRPAGVEHAVPPPLPIDRLGGFGPEFLGPFERAAVGLGIGWRHLHPPTGLAEFSANSMGFAMLNPAREDAGMLGCVENTKPITGRGGTMSTSTSPYEVGLDKNAANYVPLSPIGFLRAQRGGLPKPARRRAWRAAVQLARGARTLPPAGVGAGGARRRARRHGRA